MRGDIVDLIKEEENKMRVQTLVYIKDMLE